MTCIYLFICLWGFFSCLQGFWENVQPSFSTCTSFFFFFFKVEISSRTLIPHFRPGFVYSGSASWDDCGQFSLTSCLWAHFQIGSHTMPGQPHSPFRLLWVKGVCMFRCNLPPALLAEWPGSLTCHCGYTGVEQTPNKSQHTKLNSWEENSPTTPARIQTHNLSIMSPVLLPTSCPRSLCQNLFIKHKIWDFEFLSNCSILNKF